MIERLLIATGNVGKVREMLDLFGKMPVKFSTLADHSGLLEVEETGSTFAENAALKASGYARQTGQWCLADDSGLEVDALGGRPGVFSARYGGPDIGFPARIDLLLAELANTRVDQRTARFVCVMALADETGRIRTSVKGECLGTIAVRPLGSGGFGYDPIFVPDGYETTFGALPCSVKAAISHRARAAEKIMRSLPGFIGIPT